MKMKMENRLRQVERMAFLSAAFTILLLVVRVFVSMHGMYLFLLWNIILAGVPLVISRALIKQHALSYKAVFLLVGWLLFFPNAPYIITEIFHLSERPPIPLWFDVVMLVSAAWCGLTTATISLLQVEEFLSRQFKRMTVNLIIAFAILASAFGIYLGRFLRFNSWDIITNPRILIGELSSRFINPLDHPRTWTFTCLFGFMLLLIHHTLKSLIDVKRVNL